MKTEKDSATVFSFTDSTGGWSDNRDNTVLKHLTEPRIGSQRYLGMCGFTEKQFGISQQRAAAFSVRRISPSEVRRKRRNYFSCFKNLYFKVQSLSSSVLAFLCWLGSQVPVCLC